MDSLRWSGPAGRSSIPRFLEPMATRILTQWPWMRRGWCTRRATRLQGTQSAIVAKFNLTLTGTQALLYFTYLGGAGGTTAANGMALGSGGNIYLAGGTTSASFPVTAGAFDKTYVDLLNYGSGDGFVA